MKKYILTLLILCICGVSYAQSSDYLRPDNWRVHYNANSMRASLDGVSLSNGYLKLGATLRDDMRFSDTHDNNFHAYLRGYLSSVRLLNGYVDVTLNMRASTDTRGKINRPSYHFFYDSLDSSRRDDAWDFRLYQGNVKFDGVIPYTTLTAGRFYTDHLNDIQLDGGDLVVGTDAYNAYVYYGVPVTYYKSWLDTQAVGGGIDLNPLSFLRVRGEVLKFIDDSDFNADTLVWKVRGDLDYKLSRFVEGTIYAEGGQLEDAWVYNYGTYGMIMPTQTQFDIWIKGQYDRNDKEINYFISDFDVVTGAQSQFTQFGIRFFQGFGRHVAAGIGFETRYNYDDFYGDRDYYRYMANIDFIDLLPNNYISITAEYWDVPSRKDFKENKRIYVGGRITQVINEMFEVWGGAALTNYRYYYKQYDKIPTLADYNNKKLDNSVYIAYIGAYFQPIDELYIQLDYTYEHSQVIKDMDKDNDSISTIAMMINYNF